MPLHLISDFYKETEILVPRPRSGIISASPVLVYRTDFLSGNFCFHRLLYCRGFCIHTGSCGCIVFPVVPRLSAQPKYFSICKRIHFTIKRSRGLSYKCLPFTIAFLPQVITSEILGSPIVPIYSNAFIFMSHASLEFFILFPPNKKNWKTNPLTV